MNRTDLISATILTTCVIHNMCIDHGEINIEECINEGMEINDNMDENIIVQNCHNEISSNQKRCSC